MQNKLNNFTARLIIRPRGQIGCRLRGSILGGWIIVKKDYCQHSVRSDLSHPTLGMDFIRMDAGKPHFDGTPYCRSRTRSVVLAWSLVWYRAVLQQNASSSLPLPGESWAVCGLRVYQGYWHTVTCWHHNNCFLYSWKEETERTNANRQCKHKKKLIFMNNLSQQKQN